MKFGRMRRKAGTAIALGLAVSGCTTTSFSPPRVDVQHRTAKSDGLSCSQQSSGTALIERNIAGATALTDRFIEAYRCARAEAADGRQVFEVPSFLSLVAGAVGPTFGLTDDGRIAAVASAAVLGSAKSYYAPKDKARFLDAALDAALCVKTEAVNVSFFDVRPYTADAALQGTRETKTAPLTVVKNLSGGQTIKINIDQQYFETVSAALLTIERVLAARFAEAGTFDPAGITAQMREAVAGEAEIESQESLVQGKTAKSALSAQQQAALIELDVQKLQPKLQICILRAKA